ncbi:MAG: type II toxin-antitoxin system YafQ family toxin [Gammaproteobacteria bacterium]|nr:type II toxin-antitoxin system YafQ family toxin [Gammaproteobacteria bacterium]
MSFVERTNRFKRDLKRVLKRGKDADKLKKIILLLLDQIELPENFKDHPLVGNYNGVRECHIEPDWLLIYSVLEAGIRLERTGTHSDLFK